MDNKIISKLNKNSRKTLNEIQKSIQSVKDKKDRTDLIYALHGYLDCLMDLGIITDEEWYVLYTYYTRRENAVL